MRKLILLTAIAVLFTATDATSALAERILPVESWIKIGEERQVLNKDFGSGLIRRYYVDPDQQNGIGSTLSVFYKDGSEELFWKGWNLYTENGKVALLYQNEFVLQQVFMQTTRNMRTLRDLTDYLVAKVPEEYYKNGEFYLPSLGMCLVADQDLNRLKTAEGLSVCYIMLFARNTKP